MAVQKTQGFGLGEFEGARGRIDQRFISLHSHNFGKKHVMRSQGADVNNAAFDIQGRFCYQGRVHFGCFFRRQLHCLELVDIAARLYAAPVRGARQALRGEVDDEFFVPADNAV